jgi:carboxylesterase type B
MLNEYWTGIKGALISHVAYEEKYFTPKSVVDKETFNDFLNLFLPGDSLAQAREAIAAKYNCTLSPWKGDYNECVGTIIRDSSFTCNTRQLFDAYSNNSYMLRFAFPTDKTAVHASDLVPTFMNNYQDAYNLYYQATHSKEDATAAALRLTKSVIGPNLQQKFQAYFASFALYGNPNQLLLKYMPVWPLANGTLNELQDVMQVNGDTSPLQLVSDTQNTNDSCIFWTNLAGSFKKPPILVKQEPSGRMGPSEL